VDYSGVRAFRFENFLFKLPGPLVMGDGGTLEMPGPILPELVLRPRLPLSEAAKLYFTRRTAPDFDLGIAIVDHQETHTTLSVWHETVDTYYRFHLAGNGEGLVVALSETYASWILDAGTVTSHENVIRLGRDIAEALQCYAAYIERVAPPMTNVPAWVKDAVFMEVDTAYYGGFAGLRERLPYLSEIGFNALYLLPINEGGYNVSDHYSINPALGTRQELLEMVAEAHRLGIRVLLDLLITIVTRDSRLAREHPAYFQRDESGRICPHFKWDNAATDPASPGFRRYIAGFAAYCVRELGVDGFRVDAASANTPNWYPHSGREPWRSQLGSYGLMAEVNEAIKAVNPNAILLDELGGPMYFHVSDICHNFGFVHQVLWDEYKGQGYTVQSYKHLLSDMQDANPPDVLRVFYMRNHDAAWFSRFEGYTPEFFAYEAIHALIKGIPLVFSGQKRWPGPADADYAFYQKLFRLRREHSALVDGECLYREIQTDCEDIFSVIRLTRDELVIGLVSASDEPTRVRVRVTQPELSSAPGPLVLRDLFGGQDLKVPALGQFFADLEPYGIRVFLV
jgi:glycosidase